MPEPINAQSASHTPAEPWLARRAALAPEELACIERAVREDLKLSHDAPLSFADFARVSVLQFTSEPITDAGVAWMASADSPMVALDALFLDQTHVSDAGMVALAARDSPLRSLRVLDLADTKITDAGLAALAAKDSALTALCQLYLYNTHVTDQGMVYMAAKDSPLTALTEIWANGTKITDEGIAAIREFHPRVLVIL